MAKFTVTFADSTHGLLVEMAELLGVSMSDVLRDSLSLEWWVVKEILAGNQLLVRRGDEVIVLMIPSLEALRGHGKPK